MYNSKFTIFPFARIIILIYNDVFGNRRYCKTRDVQVNIFSEIKRN